MGKESYLKNEKMERVEIRMTQWSSDQYLKFKQQRTQPAIDLAKRIAGKIPYAVLDIGCGPGNSTAVLQKTFLPRVLSE